MNILILHSTIGFYWSIETALIGAAVALGIAAVIMFAVRSKLKSVRSQRTACKYVRDNSFRLTNQRDTFLFRNITRTPRQTNTSGGGRRR